MPFHMNAIRRSEWVGFSLGGLFGAIAFIAIWGVAPLDPFDLDWMATPFGSDSSFAGIAGLRFLKEGWSFPLGVIHGLVYPNQTSIVFADGIPFVALLAKLVASVTHRELQYFGLWGLLCAILQGGLGSVILQKSCRDSIVSAVGSIFFITSPFFLGKMFGHTSMAGQWVILLALLLIQSRQSQYVQRNEVLFWVILSVISVGVLVYFTPMVLLLMALYYWLRSEDGEKKSVYKLFVSLFFSSLGCLFSFWILGGFLSGTDISLNDYGIAPFNLNGLINPGGGSRLLRGLPMGKAGGESYSWLGLGVVVGGLYLLIDGILVSRTTPPVRLRKTLPYILISVVFIAYAATNTIMFGDNLIAEYPLPASVLSVFSMFRTSARFIWPVWYLVVILIIGGLANRGTPNWRRELVLVFLVCLQLFDSYPFFGQLNKIGHAEPPPLSSLFWARMDTDGVRHIIFAPGIAGGKVAQDVWGYIEYQAVRQNITTNTFWLGRYPIKPVLSSIDQKVEGLKKGEIADGDLFIVNMPGLFSELDFSGKVTAYHVDDQLVIGRPGLANPINGIKNIIVKHERLANYLKRLEMLGPDSLIIMTARTNETPVILDEATRQEMEKFNIRTIFDNAKDFNYVGVLGAEGRIFYQEVGKERVSYIAKEGDLVGNRPVGNEIKIVVDNNYGIFPVISVGGADFSENYIGMNICVYDLNSGKITEAGTFDLYAMTDGTYIQF